MRDEGQIPRPIALTARLTRATTTHHRCKPAQRDARIRGGAARMGGGRRGLGDAADARGRLRCAFRGWADERHGLGQRAGPSGGRGSQRHARQAPVRGSMRGPSALYPPWTMGQAAGRFSVRVFGPVLFPLAAANDPPHHRAKYSRPTPEGPRPLLSLSRLFATSSRFRLGFSRPSLGPPACYSMRLEEDGEGGERAGERKGGRVGVVGVVCAVGVVGVGCDGGRV